MTREESDSETLRQVLTLKGNIRVFCRVRPMAGPEREAGKAVAVMTPTDTDLSITSAGKITPYNFDKVFGTESTQDQVRDSLEPRVQRRVLRHTKNRHFLENPAAADRAWRVIVSVPNDGVE